MEQSSFFEGVYDTTPCRQGWHLCHTVDDEPVFFRRAGNGRGLCYVIGPEPRGHHTKLVECAPNEGPWLCEACGTFVATEACFLRDAPVER